MIINVTVETIEQFHAVLESGIAALIYIDSAFFSAEQYVALVKEAHAVGVQIGLRLPYIWRREAEQYFDSANVKAALRDGGFDCYLFRNIESALYFEEHGYLDHTGYVSDHSIYAFNKEAGSMIGEMLPSGLQSVTIPLELNEKEIIALCRDMQPGTFGTELVAYGRAPMMVSAQCLNKTVSGCTHKEKVLILQDRTKADMPVKNCCRFCYNIIYNAVPTVLYDQEKLLSKAAPDSVRLEFTTESSAEVAGILRDASAGVAARGAFTRGHLKRGV